MKHKSKYIAVCLLAVGAVGLVYYFAPKYNLSAWFVLLALVCPLMHIWMMRDHHKEQKKDQS